MKLDFDIDGMTCASCVRRVENALLKQPDVQTAHVNLPGRRASIVFVDESLQATIQSHVIEAVKKAGYTATPIVAGQNKSISEKTQDEIKGIKRNFVIALILTIPIFITEMGSHLIPPFHNWLTSHFSFNQLDWWQAVLTTLLLAWPGHTFFTKGFAALARLSPEMNSLVAVGAGSAWLYSMFVLIAPQLFPDSARHIYFEAAAVIVTLILLGRLLEAYARGRTGAAVEKLIGLKPKTARLVQDGLEKDVDIDDVLPSAILRVRPGEIVPVDGIVHEGEPYIDASMMTGEPLPVHCKPGDTVYGGTLNASTGFTLKATQTGQDTALARIIRMVEEAQDSRLPIQAKVDRVTAIFVPIIMALSCLTFLLWIVFDPLHSIDLAIISAVTVLIIACPCAMGLATPTSIMVGTGRAAQLGILFRQGDALQRLRDVTTIAFDKTGTLTLGRPALKGFVNFDTSQTDDDVLSHLASIQQQSEHPIAHAIVEAAKSKGLTLPITTDFKALSGAGVQASINEKVWLLGSEAFMQNQHVNISEHALALTEQWAGKGETPIMVACNNHLTAVLSVADPIKPDAQHVIQALKSLGISSVMITGDHPQTAQAVANELGIEKVIARVLPEGKVAAIESLHKEKNEVVAFVGDGINDAPALAAADVGIAMSSGTDVAMSSASVVLMSDHLYRVIDAIGISNATLKNIHQNLFWAFAYNVALVPIAAGALYPTFGILMSPMLAAGAMACSSLFVVGNALRLKRWAPKHAQSQMVADV
jgi:Cu+-exporting ATPase